MTQRTNIFAPHQPDAADFYAHSRAIQREAEIARSEHFCKMVSQAAKKVGDAYRSFGDVLSFTQRVNQDVRL